jgi:hypothetical protein
METRGQPANEQERVALQVEMLKREMTVVMGNNRWYMQALEVELADNPTNPMRCWCPEALVAIKKAKTHEPDKLFYGCPRWTKTSKDHCKFFQWATSPTRAPSPADTDPQVAQKKPRTK